MPLVLLLFTGAAVSLSACFVRNQDADGRVDKISWEFTPQARSGAFIGHAFGWLLAEKDRDIFRTRDGGVTWERRPTEILGRFDSICFLDSQTGWGIGKLNGHGTVWHTVDGGDNWSRIAKLDDPSSDFTFMQSSQVQFTDSLHGWIVETFTVWRTEDGGGSWVKVWTMREYGQPGRGSFVGQNGAWISNTDRQVYATQDGGKTWRKHDLTFTNLTDVFFFNDQVGWVSGSTRGTICNSHDGGETFKSCVTELGALINSIAFPTESEGWAAGTTRDSNAKRLSSRGVLLHTTDGGKTWQPYPMPRDEPLFDRIYFVDQMHGWVTARDHVYVTQDAGKTWRVSLELAPISKGN
ncbi:MAG: YCF48-related protein [Pyrinomonadaceae bacterium]